MMMSNHTAGPWTARRVDNQQWEIDALHGDTTIKHASWLGLASVYGSDDMSRESRMVAEANALLIAAAPEMLDALKLAVDTFENGGWPSATIVIAKAAIAKAEGNDA